MTTTHAVETHGLSKTFGEIRAVDNLSLSVERGEMFALVGPDGAGKTTTIRTLCGLLAPTTGSALVMGYDVVQSPELVKKQLGYLSQRFSLYGDLSVDENIEFFAEIHKVFDYKERREELLQFTRLTPFRSRLAERLSGGMKQKLALACTLIHTPEILFLDEPTTGVDPVSRRDFWSILHSLLSRGMTIVLTTPYLDEAERCTRVAFLNRGSLMVVDEPGNIKKLMKGEIVEIVCEPVRDAHRVLRHHQGVSEVHMFGDRLNVIVHGHVADGTALESRLRAGGIEVKSWRVVSPSLENVFISLMTRNETREVPT